jgi:predicted nucleotidyltransferase
VISKERLRHITDEYQANLSTILGDDLDFIVLFGSQARGDSVEGSDIDFLCIMKRPFQYGDLINRTSQVTAEISLKHDVVISRTFVTIDVYKSSRNPFLMNVYKDQYAL